MVGFIDSKGIRETKSAQEIAAYVYAGNNVSSAYLPVWIGLSINGDFVCYPADISATTNTQRPGRWGIAQEAAASTALCRVAIGGATRLVTGNAITSGAWVVAISQTGSATLSATQASVMTGSVIGLGRYSSALFGSGGMIIW